MRGDANVAADLLHHVLVGVAVAAQRLDAGVGRGIPGFGRHVLGDGAFGVQSCLRSGVDALGGFFDVGAGGFQPHHVGHDQLVGVSLLLGERRAGLNALGGVRNGAIEGSPSAPKAERRDHQARVAEDRLRLNQALAFDAADQPVGVDVNVVERQRCRVAQANAVLVFGLVVSETLRALFDDEPARTRGSIRQDRVGVGDAAVADPLLAAVDLVADDLAVFDDAIGGGLQRSQIAAGFGLGRAVGEQQSLFGDACPATSSSAPASRRR